MCSCKLSKGLRNKQLWHRRVSSVLLSPVPGDHRLALLLSQLAGSQPLRDLLTMQLVDWHRLQTDCFIQEERLRIFALLAGKPVSSATPLFCH